MSDGDGLPMTRQQSSLQSNCYALHRAKTGIQIERWAARAFPGATCVGGRAAQHHGSMDVSVLPREGHSGVCGRL